MKIAIVTIHHLSNFGSVFQAYALSKYLINCGYDVEIVDYTPPYFPPKNLRARLGRLSHPIPCIKRERKFRIFEKQNMNLSEYRYRNSDDFQRHSVQADVYIAGGDQLWNPYHPCGKDDVYKLVFVDGKKISYGTSMGKSVFSEEELTDLSSKIKGFTSISVRESSSVGLLNSCGINASHVVDPVLLMSKSEYMKFISPPKEQKYLMVYLVSPSELLDRAIDTIAGELGLKVILCGGFSKRCRCDKLCMDVGPEEVLSYLYYADFVLSASFHATLFSMIFHKQFATMLPETNTNERIEDLLTHAEQKSRIIRDVCDIQTQLQPIDYQKTDLLFEQAIERSTYYLQNALRS